jgi:hypothetical protein
MKSYKHSKNIGNGKKEKRGKTKRKEYKTGWQMHQWQQKG